MSNCSNCFNGCADIISDQCVKYTGVAIPGLGINPGDPLLVVENQIIEKILELMTGAGVIPIIDPLDLCPLVSSLLPSEGELTLNQVISALIQSICFLDARLVLAEDTLVTLNADYVIDCLAGVSANSGTHDILQATITKLCSVSTDLTTLSAELLSNYVLISNINSYIAAYISGIPTVTLYNSRMVPYTAVPYFGVTTGIFDITGAGIGQWEKIYLCNGQNLTPDLRGRALVGNTTMGVTPFNPAVDPAIPGNPNYTQNSVAGANQAFLTTPSQLPPHTHTATVTITDPGHFHSNSKINPLNGSGNELNYDSVGNHEHYGIMNTLSATTGITASSTIGSTGASTGHANIQPVHATNYIIYIP